jgi:hypothetical protein
VVVPVARVDRGQHGDVLNYKMVQSFLLLTQTMCFKLNES